MAGWYILFSVLLQKRKNVKIVVKKNKVFAKNCQRCNHLFDKSTIVEYEPQTKKQKAIRLVSIIAAIIIIIIVMIVLLNNVFKNSEIYKMTLEVLNNDPQAQMIINREIKSTSFVSGSMSISGSSGNADLSFTVNGSSGEVKVYVSGVKEYGKWIIKKLYIEDGELIRIIDEK